MNENESTVFERFLAGKGLKHSKPRDWILGVFLSMEKHVTIDELWAAVKRKHSSVGYVTVYRTMKLLSQSGLCSELRAEDGSTRYEHLYGHEHHDHLICTKCGRCLEVVDREVEKLQERLMKRHRFSPQYHRTNLYGVCEECAKRG